MSPARPLHFAKFIPPPYAGVEAHVDTLLRALLPEVQGTLVAGESPQAGPRADVPYRVLGARSFGKLVANLPLSPGVLRQARRELASSRCNILHQHAPNPWGDLTALSVARSVPVVMTWHSDIVRQRTLLKLYGPIQRRAIERADRIVVFTPRHYESSQQLHQREVGSKVVRIPIGIDFSRLAPERTDAATSAKIAGFARGRPVVGSSRVDLQACKLEYSIVSPK